ncbi:glycosyltransferase family 2 protein [Candidatus Binatia bacterium]|nr:glycosyltransferase family 2 protein [Candidatus Binatia bacterium]
MRKVATLRAPGQIARSRPFGRLADDSIARSRHLTVLGATTYRPSVEREPASAPRDKRGAAPPPRDDAVVSRPRVAVVVLDWNGGDDTLACIASVCASRWQPLDVWLVDNASRQPVLDEVARRHPGVRTIANPANLGYAGGNNVGLRAALAAGADWVLVLNNDARLAPDTIDELLAVARTDPRIAAVGAKILRLEQPDRLWMAWGEIDYRQSLVRLIGADERDDGRFAAARDVAWVSGCAILLSRRAIDAIGPFDEEYFAYHEEVDWCATAREHGLRVVYAPRAVVLHRGQASSGGATFVSRRQYLTARNMVRFVRKHGSARERLRFALWFGAMLPLSWVKRRLQGEHEGVRLKLEGALDALRGRPIPRARLGLDG